MIDPEKDASRVFLQDVLRPTKDKAFLIHFDREVELMQDLTSSREKLEKALDQLSVADSGQRSGYPSGGNPSGQGDPGGNEGGYGGGRGRRQGGGHRAGGTQFYDAIYLASDDVLKKEAGRKALIMLTDGEDNASKVSLHEAITAAQRADTLAYSIRIADEEANMSSGGFGGPGMGRHGGGGMGRGGGMGIPGMGIPGGGGRGGGGGPYGGARPDGKKILQQILRETGGGYFEYSKKKSIGDIYQQIEEELRNQYSIGYTPDRSDATAGYHKIKLTLRGRKGLVVQAREGYYAGDSRT